MVCAAGVLCLLSWLALCKGEGHVWTPRGSRLGQVPDTPRMASRVPCHPLLPLLRHERCCGGKAVLRDEDSRGGGSGLLGSRGQGPAPPAAPRKASPLQPAPPLELEALRLSLSHMHTERLELTQATLQKEKEAALTELRDTLSGRHAQELALLQSRWRLELELAREQHAREREELVQRHRQETGECRGPRGPPALPGEVLSAGPHASAGPGVTSCWRHCVLHVSSSCPAGPLPSVHLSERRVLTFKVVLLEGIRLRARGLSAPLAGPSPRRSRTQTPRAPGCPVPGGHTLGPNPAAPARTGLSVPKWVSTLVSSVHPSVRLLPFVDVCP